MTRPVECVNCFLCQGNGRILHPDAKSDPIEGHKLSDRITCPVCHDEKRGHTNQPRWAAIRAYQEEYNRAYRRRQKTEEKKRAMESREKSRALAKLTDRQKQLLGLS